MDGFLIQQGSFTSDGAAKILQIRSDVDYMTVINRTQWATTQATGRGVKFEWQRGLSAGQAFEYTKTDSTNVLNGEFVTSGGFTLLDTSDQTPGAEVTGTTITKADPPVCTATSHGYSTGDNVRIYASDEMDQMNGMVFTVTSTGANTFTLDYMDTNTANFTASTEFKARRVPDTVFSPPVRTVTAISAAASAVVTMSVTHGLVVGDLVRMVVPAAFGMVEMDGLAGQVTAINTTNNTITLDIDSSAFTAFAWPAATAAPLTFAQVVPIGPQNAVTATATQNASYLGMKLGAGIDGPAGSSSDVIYWACWKAWSVENE